MSFLSTIQQGYTFSGEAPILGVGIHNGEPNAEAVVRMPLKTLNRHGLIAGATGTGKTKTLQMMAEALSDASVPVLLMDIKGDMSGLAAAGTLNDKLTERYQRMNMEWKPLAYPCEMLTLSEEKGLRLRATVMEFGPILLSKILGLNDTQAGLVAMIFKYADDEGLPIVDLKDFIKLLQYVGDEGKTAMEKTYGKISTSSTGTILRKVIELQQQGADLFFGEPSFDVNDLMRTNNEGRGMISILRLTDMQSRPKLFSTFMLQLLAELYSECPEAGDEDRPRLVMFIDEAHLVFNEASDALMDQLESIIKLIRSKGIGIFFCTQNPQDVPAAILGQLGLKVQHALRAFTAADRKTIKQAAENFPETEFYQTDELLTQMGIGEAFVTLLNEKGIPTPLVHTLLRSPASRMGVISPAELDGVVAASRLAARYNREVDSESAHEILTRRIEAKMAAEEQVETAETRTTTATQASRKAEKEESFFDNPIVKQVGRTAATIITRGLLGAIGFGGSRSRKKTSWF